MTLSPGQKEGANNNQVRTATWNTRTLIDNDTIDVLINEFELMEIYITAVSFMRPIGQ